MNESIIDTNIPLAAAEKSHVSIECVGECANLIEEILNNEHLLVLDDDYMILGEYENKMSAGTQNNYAKSFLKWIYTNQANPKRVKLVKINRNGQFDFKEFPNKLNVVGFDNSDKKFVAVAMANNNLAPIYQAADSKWIGWEKHLNNEGVKVIFLCKAELTQKYKKKMAK